jgi:hypothetical protein
MTDCLQRGLKLYAAEPFAIAVVVFCEGWNFQSSQQDARHFHSENLKHVHRFENPNLLFAQMQVDWTASDLCTKPNITILIEIKMNTIKHSITHMHISHTCTCTFRSSCICISFGNLNRTKIIELRIRI